MNSLEFARKIDENTRKHKKSLKNTWKPHGNHMKTTLKPGETTRKPHENHMKTT